MMSWFDPAIPADLKHEPLIINDSKTPSGRVHVGALRGVLIHDAVFRTLQARGLPVRFLYGVDDYDPLDELPAGQGEHFRKYLGQPLCAVPPPPGSDASDMAEHYISEFFEVFEALGVKAEKYRMRDIYRSGRFNEAIDVILRNADVVRRVYKKISNSDRPANWLPLQVICERCGRIGTTEVIAYSGGEVTYRCRADLVTWAEGCGHSGHVSPFDGGGKLPWKLEWAAKWHTFPVTIEGAGKDHSTRGGSRDVALACLREIFGESGPVNIPYEFFLVGGAKMSSSRGIGAAAKDMADFLGPEILRFLVLRTHPSRQENFTLSEDYLVKLFNDFDRHHVRATEQPTVREDEKRLYLLSEISPEGPFFDANFQLLLTLLQMPHVDAWNELEKRKGAPLNAIEIKHIQRRMRTAQEWLDKYARDEDRLRLQAELPSRAAELGPIERAFLHALADILASTKFDENELQSRTFNTARMTPIPAAVAFQAIYRVLFDRDSGPKAGSVLVFLDREFVCRRFRELPVSTIDFWRASSIEPARVEEWLRAQRPSLTRSDMILRALPGAGPNASMALEIVTTRTDDRQELRRVLLDPSFDSAAARKFARDWAGRLCSELAIPVDFRDQTTH
jgi:lysyl-tRNA synthetase class 1